MIVDPDRVAEAIATIVHDEILPRFGNLSPDEVRQKESPSDLVTEVDESVERSLKRALMGMIPTAGFVGEESAAADPSVVEQIKSFSACWIVDPLDGTRNFIRGVEEFGTIVALVENGRTTMGWVYDAPAKTCATAIAGEGAFWAGVKISPDLAVRAPPSGLRSLGWLDDQWREKLKSNLAGHFQTIANHCSAYAYIKLAKGAVDFKVSSRIHAWDHAAGALLLAEAGGHTAYLDDREIYAADLSNDRPLLATAPGRHWPTIARKLIGATG